MIRRLTAAAALLLLSLAPLSCGLEGPSCCALKRFCSTCSTCTSANNATALKGDETACQVVVDRFKSENQFCNPEDKPPKHAIDEFVMMCER